MSNDKTACGEHECVSCPQPTETVEIRESFLQAAKFVERETELAQLSEALDGALEGQGSAWLVGGESGVGKSRLTDELRTPALVKGALLLRGQAVSEGSSPYHLWREVLRLLALATDLKDEEAGVLKALVPDVGDLLGRKVRDAPHLDPASTGALLLSRSVVIVMSDDPPSVQTTAQFLLALHKLGVEMGRVRVALNHIHDTQDVPAATIQKALKRPLSAEIPYNANHMNAIRRGVPHIIAEPNSPFSQAIQQLARTMGI